jgi:hypothetical protein
MMAFQAPMTYSLRGLKQRNQKFIERMRSMTIEKRIVTALMGMALVISAGSLPLLAQEPAAKKAVEKQDKAAPAPAPAVKKKADPSRRVPDYFGQIGLTPEQRESIYKLRKTHHEKIDALKKEIADHENKSLDECEALLTDTQKKLLDNLRTSSTRTTRAADPAKSPK